MYVCIYIYIFLTSGDGNVSTRNVSVRIGRATRLQFCRDPATRSLPDRADTLRGGCRLRWSFDALSECLGSHSFQESLPRWRRDCRRRYLWRHVGHRWPPSFVGLCCEPDAIDNRRDGTPRRFCFAPHHLRTSDRHHVAPRLGSVAQANVQRTALVPARSARGHPVAPARGPRARPRPPGGFQSEFGPNAV